MFTIKKIITNGSLTALLVFLLQGCSSEDTAPAQNNTPPIAQSTVFKTQINQSVVATLSASDQESDALTLSIARDPAHGTVKLTGEKATYTPAAGYTGTDKFTFRANDGKVNSNVATVSITVEPLPVTNTPPTANSASLITPFNTSATLALAATDAENDALTFSIITNPVHGTATLNGNTLRYVPATNYAGTDTLTFRANDGKANSNTATVNITVESLPVTNTAPAVNAGSDQIIAEGSLVNLKGTANDADGDALSYAWSQNTSNSVQINLTGASTLTPSFTAPMVETDTTLTFTLTARDSKGAQAQDLVEVTIQNIATPPSSTSKMNDTGMTACGDYARGHSGINTNNSSCSLLVDADNDPIPPGQDGTSGRDADIYTNEDSDGYKGFSFTKLSATGSSLPATASEWSCVKDNVMGLTWEVKTDDGTLHDKDDTFTWYETDSRLGNGGLPGYQLASEYDTSYANNTCGGYTAGNTSSYCNTKAYLSRVNSAGLCGVKNWRLPTREELESIVSYGLSPRVDSNFFPYTLSSDYWTSSAYAYLNRSIWVINFSYGGGSPHEKQNTHAVRLVHD